MIFPEKKIIYCLILLLTISTTVSTSWGRKTLEKKKPKECPSLIFGLIPSQGDPSSPITLYGKNLSSGVRLYVGEKGIPFNYIDDDIISFQVPKLKAGSYELFLKNKKQCKSKTVLLKVTEREPVISSLIPNQIYYCTPSKDRVVLLKGDNFFSGAKVLFDDVVVGSKILNKKEIEIKVPQAKSGLHRLQVINPGGTSSLSYNFYIEGRPVIYNITVGIKYKNHYELVIEGENFLWGSIPLVEGKAVDEGLTYQGCNVLVYDRKPKAEAPAELSIQVVNPDGLKSNLFHLAIP